MRVVRNFCSGQSLIEVLVAISIGIILIVGAVTAISPSLRIGSDIRNAQVVGALAKELADNVRVIADRDWHIIDGLATTSANRYYVVASTSPFTVATGTESILVSTSTYARYFYVDDVKRNTSGKIDESGMIRDPSTKRITIVYAWPPLSASSTIVAYVTRHENRIVWQTDWSRGPNQDGPYYATTSAPGFSSSSNIDYTTSTGSIVIQGF